MKHLTAILLSALLFFNWYGYRIITGYLQKTADHKLTLQIDNSSYDESQLIELKVELNVPYQQQQTDYERHYGEIEIDGKSYTYVKRKIENGFLILKCIPNYERDQLKTANNDYLRMVVGLNHENNNNKTNQTISLKNFWSEYNNQFITWQTAIQTLPELKYVAASASSLQTIYLPTALKPPQGFSALHI